MHQSTMRALRLDAERLGPGAIRDYDHRRAIGHAAGIAGRHHPVLPKHRLHARELFRRDVGPRAFVLDHRAARSALLDLDRRDVAAEELARRARPALALDGVVVHRLAPILEVLGEVLGRLAHQLQAEGVAIGPVQRVDHGLGPTLVAPPSRGDREGRAREILAAARHGDLAMARHDLLRRRDDGLCAGAAGAIHVERRALLRQSRLDRYIARREVALLIDGEDIAPDQMIDVFGIEHGLLQARLGRVNSHIRQRDVLERLAEVAERRAHAAGENDLPRHRPVPIRLVRRRGARAIAERVEVYRGKGRRQEARPVILRVSIKHLSGSLSGSGA